MPLIVPSTVTFRCVALRRVWPLMYIVPAATTHSAPSIDTPSPSESVALGLPSDTARPSTRSVGTTNAPLAPPVPPLERKSTVAPSPTVSSSTPLSVPDTVSVTPSTASSDGITSSPPDSMSTCI